MDIISNVVENKGLSSVSDNREDDQCGWYRDQ